MSSSVNALFIGNSYTHFNNLPTLVTLVLQSLPNAPSSVQAAMVASDGATVAQLLGLPESLERIRDGDFTHVVIQGQSYEPLVGFASFNDSATRFVAAINASGAQPVLYETWAREARSPDYEMTWSGGSPDAMHAGLRSAYLRVAQSSGATMAPVGDAFARCVTLWPHINLYDSDLAHPSRLGSSLAAFVFANVFTGQPTTGSGSKSTSMMGIDADDGAKLQAVADCVCDELRGVATSCQPSSSASLPSRSMSTSISSLPSSSSQNLAIASTSTLASSMAASGPSVSSFTWLIVILVFGIALTLLGGLVYFKYRSNRFPSRSGSTAHDDSTSQASLMEDEE